MGKCPGEVAVLVVLSSEGTRGSQWQHCLRNSGEPRELGGGQCSDASSLARHSVDHLKWVAIKV